MRIVCLALVCAAVAQAQEAALFASDAPLSLTLAFDVEAVTDDRSDAPPWYPATLTVTDGGEPTTLALGVRTRGYYRLHHLDCDIPPLRLNLRTREAGGTLFEGQDRLKLVTHCRDGREADEQRLLQEYLLYRAYQILTDVSFRTRLARITYHDRTGERDDVTHWGFLIEEPEQLAERLGGQTLDARVHPDATDRQQVTLMSVFHYMVGNTDWTVTTLHNVRLVYLQARADSLSAAGVFDGRASAILAVPYDFDWAGLVDAPYATPDPILGISSVRQRTYLGFCRERAELGPILDRFQARRADLQALFREFPPLDPEVAAASLEYLDGFYEQISTERGIDRAFMRDCQGR